MKLPVVILLLIVTPVFLQSDCENLQRTYKVLTTVTVFLQRGEGRKKEKKLSWSWWQIYLVGLEDSKQWVKGWTLESG